MLLKNTKHFLICQNITTSKLMNIFAAFRARIEEIISELIKQGVVKDSADLSRISVEPPREASHGDMATNAAMVLGKFSELQILLPLILQGRGLSTYL